MVRRAPSRRRRKKSGAAGLILVLLAFVLLSAAASAVAWFALTPVAPPKATFIEIAPGSSSRQIAAQLEQAGVVRSQFGFDLVRLVKRGNLKAGEYLFERAEPATAVYSRIARGDVFTLPVTIPEGANRFDIAARVEQAGLAKEEDMLAAEIKDTALIADLDPHATSLEGYLFPDTYRFQRKATPLQILSAMVRRFRAEAAQAGLLPPRSTGSVHAVVTLASLVERETAVDSERPQVASVLTNRLAKGMPLMTDPALIYGLLAEGRWRGAIYQSDLSDPKKDTPYNTYRHAGLPPGPIANPGLPALRAAVSPAATDYLYFVAAGADPQGKSRFASSLDEHNKNVASYRQAVRQSGGR